MQHDLAIFGAGGLGREVAILVSQINKVQPEWNLVGFFDDMDRSGQTIAGHPYLGTINELNAWPKPLFVVLAIGNPAVKQELLAQLTNPMVHFPVLCHPASQPAVEQNVEIGKGSIICQGVIFTIDITLGDHVLLNLGTTVGHDARIGNYCSIMPGVRISGETTLAEGVYMGTNAVILNRTSIGKGCTIGAGAVVTRPLPENITAVGVPAEIIRAPL